MELHGDERRTRLAIDTEFDATGLERFIQLLAERRSEMTPCVVTRPAAETPLPLIENPSFIAHPRTDGLDLLLRSDGFGWMQFRLNAHAVNGLRALMEEHARSESASLGQKRPDGGRSN